MFWMLYHLLDQDIEAILKQAMAYKILQMRHSIGWWIDRMNGIALIKSHFLWFDVIHVGNVSSNEK